MKLLVYFLLFSLAICGYFILIEIMFIDRRLVEIKGQLFKKHLFIKPEVINKKQAYYSYLTFMLKDQSQFFILKLKTDSINKEKNIFEGIDKSIANANEISVWIQKTDQLDVTRPHVYRVDADGEIVFDRLKKPIEEYVLYLALVSVIIAFMGLNYLGNRINKT